MKRDNVFYIHRNNVNAPHEIYGGVKINDDFEMILCCAVRYALGRMTYIPSEVTEYITPLLCYLSNKTIEIFKRDIHEHSKYEDGLGMDCDKKVWMDFYNACSDEITRRINDSKKCDTSTAE